MQRVLRVRESMRRQEEWKLAEREREAAALAAAQDRLFAFFDGNEIAGGPLIETMARTARGLSERITAADRARAEQAGRVLEEARKTKLAERRCDDLSEDARRTEEKRDLAEWIERAAAGRAHKGE